jgi:hypothetical protein
METEETSSEMECGSSRDVGQLSTVMLKIALVIRKAPTSGISRRNNKYIIKLCIKIRLLPFIYDHKPRRIGLSQPAALT